MICGLLLAGGESRRFGGDKLRACLADGRPLIVAAAAPWLGAVDRRVVVTQPERYWLIAALRADGWQVVADAACRRGIGASLAAGVRATRDAQGWLIGLADMPTIRPTTIAAVAGSLRAGARLAAPVHNGRRGHPVGFGSDLAPALMGLDGDEGARAVVRANHDDLALIGVDDPGILMDIDTTRDLAQAASPGSVNRP